MGMVAKLLIGFPCQTLYRGGWKPSFLRLGMPSYVLFRRDKSLVMRSGTSLSPVFSFFFLLFSFFYWGNAIFDPPALKAFKLG